MRTFDELFASLSAGDETGQIEAKRASELGKATLMTITAYANEPGLGGGYLLLGVAKNPTTKVFEIVGIPDPDKLQNDLASKCATAFNHPVRPQMVLDVHPDGKRTLTVRVPESDPNEKPIYLHSLGLPRGACRRIGSSDQHFSDDDLTRIIELRNENSFDASIVRDATIDDIDPVAVKEYRRTRLNREAEELTLKNPELLVAIGAATRSKNGDLAITRAGLLLFGKKGALRRFSPSLRIDYIQVAGQSWIPDAEQPLKSTEIQQGLLLAVPRIADLVLQDLPTTILVKGRGLRRKERPAIPSRVIREAIVNAVMHRSYRTQKPIQIIRFSNRLEIRNPGHSLVSTDELGQPGSKTRNEKIARVLQDSGYAETKGMGISVMRQQMRDANMTEPIFHSSRQDDTFEVTLFTHHLLDAETVKWLSRFTHLSLSDADTKALVVVREKGLIDNATYRAINDVDVLTASFALRHLRDVGLLEAHGKSTATFYGPTALLLGVQRHPNPEDKKSLSSGLGASSVPMSPELLALLKKLGGRTASKDLVEIAILKLCATKPMTLPQLATYLARSTTYLRTRFITRMMRDNKLDYLYPDTPAHPKQAYVTPLGLMDIPIPAEAKKKRRGKKLPLFDR